MAIRWSAASGRAFSGLVPNNAPGGRVPPGLDSPAALFDQPFEIATKSFQTHSDAGGNRSLYLGHPEFEGFDVIQTIEPGKG